MIRRLHLITNPHGGVGNNLALAERARVYLGERGVETDLQVTERAGHAREMVVALEGAEGEAVCGIGGDGTMHELVNGMMEREPARRLPLTLLPGGTGNSFLRDVGGLDPATILDRLGRDARRWIDVFEVVLEDRVVFGFNIVGWGLFSAGNQLAESLRVLGRRRYDVAALCLLIGNRRFRGTLEVEGETLEGSFPLVVVANTIHTGEGMKIAPRAKLDDGLLDLIYLTGSTRRSLFRLFVRLRRGAHLGEPGVHCRHVREMKLSTSETLPINLDGELIEGGSFTVRVRPGALEMLL